MRLRFNKAQIKELAQISGNLCVLFFGIVATPAFTQVDDVSPTMVILGVGLGFLFLTESMILLKGVSEYES